jgi:hypothetical protein
MHGRSKRLAVLALIGAALLLLVIFSRKPPTSKTRGDRSMKRAGPVWAYPDPNRSPGLLTLIIPNIPAELPPGMFRG